MNKQDFSNLLAIKLNKTKKEASFITDIFLETLRESLIEDGKIMFVGDWSLEIKEKASRLGRNPATGEEIQIPAKNAIKFKVGKVLADLVNN